MANSEGYNKHLLPFLEERINQSFPDPSEFDNDESYLYAAKTASIFKKVSVEILQWIEQQIKMAMALEKKQKGEVDNKFDIGA